MKLTPRLTLTFVLYAAALLAAVGLLAYDRGRASLRSATISELQSMAIEKQSALNAWVEEKRGEIARLAADPAIVSYAATLVEAPPASPEGRAAHDQWLLHVEAESGFTELMFIEPQTGLVLAATDAAEEGKFKESQSFFLNGKIDPYVQNPYYSVSLQAPAMTAAAPVRGVDGQLLGVVAGRLNLAEMNAIINRRTGLHQTDDAFLVNTSSLFVTQPRFINDLAVLQRGVHTEDVDRCLTKSSGVVDQQDYRGLPVIAVYQWLPERGLCLIVKLDQAEAYAPARAFGSGLAMTGLVALLAAGALAAVLARSLTRPILTLQAGAARIGQGDLGLRLPESSRDELGALGREFNAMAESIKEYATTLERRVAERTAELEAANKELEAFSYSVSHDLRAPLRAADGFSRIVLDDFGGGLDPEGRRYLNLVRSSTQQMGRLIDDLLAFSRLGRQELARRRVNPASVARQALEQLQPDGGGPPLPVEIDDMADVDADPSLLRQVYVNLLSNAFKFTRGRTTPEIRVGSKAENGETVFFVQDNGVGFDAAYAGKMFGVFQRLHRAEDYEGTGVGLAIVQRIVHRHAGRVWAEGAVDRGATFYFTIPERRDR